MRPRIRAPNVPLFEQEYEMPKYSKAVAAMFALTILGACFSGRAEPVVFEPIAQPIIQEPVTGKGKYR
jgi:hypothetical protein